MKKLLDLFNNLPPQTKALLAMAGLGAPVAVFYMIKGVLFPHWSSTKAFLVMAVFIVALSLLASLVSWLWSGGARRRRRELSTKMIEDTESGAASMSDREKIKANNRKFADAVKEMRKTLKVDVYDLPWYIVLGDSGCGKTRLINEGELTFSAGKPEGYQLGTLDYNWWFTEDAIFVDMAGRLCNPQEDRDRREWLGVLDTIGRYRKGFPINGAIACVSVEHLLNDSIEKQEQDANTMLERLRDLQQKLGVTFATYLVVTKCDKILGFMPFFDRSEHGATFKHQIFGWSRPGAFNERYDPELFDADFEALYGRLSDWRLRRLGDDSDEIELGLAYTFPEEFRSLREPLQIYVRKLFPLLKNPRGVKNLVFRGVYFTSATQQGEVILKHLKERLGADAGSDIPLLESLYPRPKPHFVKDLLFKKVFPEHGLVFRDEGQVHSNRRLGRILWIGSAVLGLALATLLYLSFSSFKGLMADPREHARSSTDAVAYYPAEPTPVHAKAALQLAGALSGDVETLRKRPWAASVLGWGSIDRVIDSLATIRSRLLEESVVRRCLMDVEDALAKGVPGPQQAANYADTLIEYARWYAATNQETPPVGVGPQIFDHARPLLAAGAFTRDNWDALLKEGEVKTEAGPKKKHGPIWEYCARASKEKPGARTLPRGSRLLDYLNDQARGARIKSGIEAVQKHYLAYARLEGPGVTSDWKAVRAAWPAIRNNYTKIIDTRPGEVADTAQLKTLRDQLFAVPAGAYTEMSAGFKTIVDRKVNVDTLKTEIARCREQWSHVFSGLQAVPAVDESRIADIKARAKTAIEALDTQLGRSLALSGEPSAPPADISDEDKIAQAIKAINDQNLDLTMEKEQILVPSNDVATVEKLLADAFHGLNASPDADDELAKKGPAEWLQTLTDAQASARAGGSGTGPDKPSSTAPALADQLSAAANWKKDRLLVFTRESSLLASRVQRTRVLNTVSRRLDSLGEWGWAELYPDRSRLVESPYTILIPSWETVPPDKGAAADTPPAGQPPPSENRPSPSRRPKTEAPATVQPTRATPSGPPQKARMHNALTREFWNRCADDFLNLKSLVGAIEPTMYMGVPGKDLVRECRDKADSGEQRYHQMYVAAWNNAYQTKTTEFAALLGAVRGSGGWSEVTAQFAPAQLNSPQSKAAELNAALGPTLEWILKSTRWVSWDPRSELVSDPAVNWSFEPPQWTLGGFVAQAKEPARLPDGTAPWEAVSGEIVKAWTALATALAENTAPADMLKPNSGRSAGKIPWGQIRKLQTDYGLADEDLTRQLVAFEDQVRLALSLELTQILRNIQQAHFGGNTPWRGWPYFQDQGGDVLRGTTMSDFRAFLIDVHRVRRVLGPLEEGLDASIAGRSEREEFYRQCEAWANFLFEKGAASLTDNPPPEPKPLQIRELKWEDPLENQDLPGMDTPQHFYRTVEFRLGLRQAQGIDDPQKVPTLAADRRERERRYAEKGITAPATWEWQTGKPLELVFTDGFTLHGRKYESQTVPLGASGDFAFLAYLCHYNPKADTTSGREFVVEHKTNLKPPMGSIDTLIVRIRFRLDRPVPEPIKMLPPVETRAATPGVTRADQ